MAILLCGLAPALHAVRGNLNERLMGSGKGVGTSSGHGRLRSALVVAEVALSIVLLVGAGMAMRSLFALQDVDLGFNPTNIMTARVALPPGRYDKADQKRVFFQQVLARVAALPGVKAATATTSLPPYAGIRSEITVPGKTHTDRWESLMELCSPGYFSTLGLNFLHGRLLSEEDINTARHVAVINEQFARNYFPNEDPIGKTVKFNLLDRQPDAPHDAYFEIVGIVRNIKNQGVKDSPLPEAFVPYTITGAFVRGILVRTTADPLVMLPTVRREIAAVDSGVPLTDTGSVESYLQQFTYAGPQFSLIMMGATAGVGLVLVVIGIFSVMAYSVSLQTHDIGIRMAVGAQQRDVLRVVVRQGGRLIGLGILLGLFASFVLAQYIGSQFWGVSVTDPFTYRGCCVPSYCHGPYSMPAAGTKSVQGGSAGRLAIRIKDTQKWRSQRALRSVVAHRMDMSVSWLATTSHGRRASMGADSVLRRNLRSGVFLALKHRRSHFAWSVRPCL